MATNAFETIRLNAAGEEKSYQWYRQQISSLGKLTNTNQILKDTKVSLIFKRNCIKIYVVKEHM